MIAALRGAPMFANGNLRVIALVLLVNAVWGAATMLLVRTLPGTRPA